MSTFTTNYRLVKPAASDKYSISDFNNNFDTLDTTLKDIANKAGDGIINGLTSTSTTNSLSAAQGKVLNDRITTTENTLNTKFNNYLPVNGNAVTATRLAAFSGIRTEWTWGTLLPANGFNQIIEYQTALGGGIAFADDNQANAQTSVQIDGKFYQNEGRDRVLDTSDLGSYAFYKWSPVASTTTGISHSLTITTHGRPVFCCISGDGNPRSGTGTSWHKAIISRGSTTLCTVTGQMENIDSHNQPLTACFLDIVPAGTYTYNFSYTIGAGTIQYGEEGVNPGPQCMVFEI